MSLPLPSSLSPSKLSAFRDCALAFRFAAIDRLPEPPAPWTTLGTLVHRALELLFWENPAGGRSLTVALANVDRAWEEMRGTPDVADLQLGDDELARMTDDARDHVRRYFELEDPDGVRVLGTELTLEAPLGGTLLRGIIDRLEVDDEGRLVVTDYKTGRVPGRHHEHARLGGVHFYAWLCQQTFGVRPARVQLLYLSEPVAISTVPTAQSVRGVELKAGAVWAAVERACRAEDFRPRPSGLCPYCSFRQHCPAFGGDPAAVRLAGRTPVEAAV
ncbi:MAG TPA: PD-(D/E)XK nuclease family protein [Acidimicrobiales bacterium]|nr:PD-(D/E)XK nuclease family protein [Acidimicrobiales bacterium]